jgi:outer membrane immunogenic protein
MTRFAVLFAATALSFPAFAADIISEEPPAPMAMVEAAPTWTGLYLGVQGGGAFNPDDGSRLRLSPNGFGLGDPVLGLTAPANNGFAANTLGAAFGDNFSEEFDSSFMGGAHIGYDYQIGSVVLGAVVDINALNVSQTASAFSNTPAFYTAERELDYLVTGRLRAGYTFTPSFLAYATGGVAYGEVDYSFSTDSPAVAGNPRSTATARAADRNENEDEFGYTVGGGVDFLVTENISIGAEYLYTNLGGGDSYTRLDGGPFDGNAANGGATTGNSTDFESRGDFDFHTITAKVAYRFN